MIRRSISIGKIMEETWTLVDSLNLMGSFYREGFFSDRDSLHEGVSGPTSWPSGPLCSRNYRKLVYPQYLFFFFCVWNWPIFLATDSPQHAAAIEAGMITLKIKRMKRFSIVHQMLSNPYQPERACRSRQASSGRISVLCQSPSQP